MMPDMQDWFEPHVPSMDAASQGEIRLLVGMDKFLHVSTKRPKCGCAHRSSAVRVAADEPCPTKVTLFQRDRILVCALGKLGNSQLRLPREEVTNPRDGVGFDGIAVVVERQKDVAIRRAPHRIPGWDGATARLIYHEDRVPSCGANKFLGSVRASIGHDPQFIRRGRKCGD